MSYREGRNRMGPREDYNVRKGGISKGVGGGRRLRMTKEG